MEIKILLSERDIRTRRIGLHYEINPGNGVSINFSPSALNEFLHDINELKQEDDKEIINEPGN